MENVMLSTGEQIVYCVFHSDGECGNFVGVFATQQAAEGVAERLREVLKREHEERYKITHPEWELSDSVSVESKIVGSNRLLSSRFEGAARC